jgi:hypothetical protein
MLKRSDQSDTSCVDKISIVIKYMDVCAQGEAFLPGYYAEGFCVQSRRTTNRFF